MSRIHIEHLYRIDLDEGVAEYTLSEPLMHQDAQADVFTAVLRRGMTPADLTGMQVMAYITFAATKQTLALRGAIDGSAASITFDEACYAIPGGFRMALQLVQSDTRRTVLTVTGDIRRTATDNVITGNAVVPTLPELLGKIAAMEQATEETRQATTEAEAQLITVQAATAELLGSAASSVVVPVSGDVITVQDACADRAFPGLSLMGKTWQDGTPSPDAPVPLEHAGADGSIWCGVRGKNLISFTGTNQTVNGVKFTIQTDGSIYVNGTATGAAVNYAICGGWQAKTGIVFAKGMRYSTSTGISGMSAVAYGYDASGAYVNIPHGVLTENYTDVHVYLVINVGVTVKGYFVPTLSVNGWESTYEPYVSGGSVTVATAEGLPGIPVASSGNYTDENGQQWICDEIDMARGVYVQRIERKRITSLNMYGPSSTTGLMIGFDPALQAKVLNNVGMSNALPRFTPEQQWVSNASCFAVNANGAIVQVAGCTTLEALNAYLAANEIIVQVALKTPVETELPADELAAFLQLRSPYGPMTVYNDAGAGQKVSYVADTKLYIDQKMAALISA